jgi:hypothetical protein
MTTRLKKTSTKGMTHAITIRPTSSCAGISKVGEIHDS